MKLGQHGKALTQAQKAVDKKPDFADAKKLIESIEYTTDAKAVPEAEQDAEAQPLPKVSMFSAQRVLLCHCSRVCGDEIM